MLQFTYGGYGDDILKMVDVNVDENSVQPSEDLTTVRGEVLRER